MMPQNFVLQPPPQRKCRQAVRNKRGGTGQPELLTGQSQSPETNQEHDPGPQAAADVRWRKREEIKYSLFV